MACNPGLLFWSVLRNPGAMLWLLAVALLCGCGANDGNIREADDEPGVIVEEIKFVGIQRFTKEQILEYLHTHENSWWDWTIFVETSYYNEAYVRKDVKQIEKLYHSYGYFQAQVIDFQLEMINEKDRTGRVVVEVKEGLPSLVTVVEFQWPEGEVHREAVEAASRMVVGEVFETQKLIDSVNEMTVVLREHAYALAKIEESAKIDREARTASVRFRLLPGPYCTIGEIRYDGLRMAPKDLVDDEVDFAPGKPYHPTLMRRIEQAVYAMDVFDSIAVQHDDALDANGRLGISVSVVESRSQRVKVGAGLGIEPNRWMGRVSLLYSHLNPFGDLTRLDLRVVAGYAVLPYPWRPDEHGPVFKLIPAFKKKGWLEPKLVWTIRPSFELNVEEGYQYYAPKLRLGVSRFLFGFTLIEASYNIHFFDFFDTSKLLSANDTILGRDFDDPYLLSYLELSYTVFLTDDFFNPNNGVVFKLTWDSAGTIVGGHYDYHKLVPEVRGYWKVFSHLQMAARVRTGYIWPYAWRPGVPISEKFYLGGSDTVRGWGLKRLSPRIEECDPDGSNCSSLPIGGNTMLMGNLELRFLVVKDFYIVPFFDFGDVQPGELEYHPSQWSYSTGGGMRYNSPVGKFRLDFGWRLNETDRFKDEQRWSLHFSLGETF